MWRIVLLLGAGQLLACGEKPKPIDTRSIVFSAFLTFASDQPDTRWMEPLRADPADALYTGWRI